MSTQAQRSQTASEPSALIGRLKKPSPIQALLWKDLGMVKLPVLQLGVAMLACQALLVTGAVLTSDDQLIQSLSGMATVLPFVGPWLGLMACAGMLIGHERETRTWNWSSSLPITSRQALFSRVSVTIAAAVSLALVLCPLALFALSYASVPQEPEQAFVKSPGLFSVLVAANLLLTIATLFSATLIFRDTLTGLVVGIMANLGVFIALVLSQLVEPMGFNPPWLIGAGISLVGLILTLAWLLHGWRWGVGQNSSLGFRPRLTSASDKTAPKRIIERTGKQPSEFGMLFDVGVRSSLVLRSCILIAMLVALSISSDFQSQEEPFFASWLSFCCIACALLGLTAFSADKSKDRIQFFSDRGVATGKFVLSRLLAAAVYVVSAALICLIFKQLITSNASLTIWEEVGIARELAVLATLMLFGSLVSICCEKQTVALALTLIIAVALLVVYGMSYQLYEINLHSGRSLSTNGSGSIEFPKVWVERFATDKRWFFRYALNAIGTITLPSLIAVLYFAANRQLLRKRVSTAGYLVVGVLAMLFPIAIACIV